MSSAAVRLWCGCARTPTAPCTSLFHLIVARGHVEDGDHGDDVLELAALPVSPPPPTSAATLRMATVVMTPSSSPRCRRPRRNPVSADVRGLEQEGVRGLAQAAGNPSPSPTSVILAPPARPLPILVRPQPVPTEGRPGFFLTTHGKLCRGQSRRRRCCRRQRPVVGPTWTAPTVYTPTASPGRRHSVYADGFLYAEGNS